MISVESYLAVGRSFLVTWLSSVCDVLWLPLLRGMYWSRQLLPRPEEGTPLADAALLAASL